MGILLSAGGIIGNVLVRLINAKVSIFYVQTFFLELTAISILLPVNSVSSLTFVLFLGLWLGELINDRIAGLYISPMVYDADVRTTGRRLATGFGRTGAILMSQKYISH